MRGEEPALAGPRGGPRHRLPGPTWDPTTPPISATSFSSTPSCSASSERSSGARDVPEVELTSGLDGRPDLLDDGRHLALAAARTFEGNDLPACYLEHGPDIEGGAEEALRPSYAPALGQVLQRAHGEEHVRPPDGPSPPRA